MNPSAKRSSPILVVLPPELRQQLGHIEALSSVSSTNQWLMDNGKDLPNFSVCLAREQTQGRGRQGKIWDSPLGSGFYGSLLWRPSQPLSQLPPISLLAGLALAESYQKWRPGEPYTLKWPNDLLTPAGKLAGILVESQCHADGLAAVIIGMGLNLLPPALNAPSDSISMYPRAGLFPAPDLANEAARSAAFWQVASVWLSQLMSILQQPMTGAALVARWRQHDGFVDQAVQLRAPDQSVRTGIANGINDKGALSFRDANTQDVLLGHSGEWSIDWQHSQIAWRGVGMDASMHS